MSEGLHAALFSSLDHRLCLSVYNLADNSFVEWMDLFFDDVTSLAATACHGFTLLFRVAERIFSAPNLRAVVISARPSHLSALTHPASVREVTIYVFGCLTVLEVLNALAKVRVERLCTVCVVPERCMSADPHAFGPDCNALAGCCPQLTCLEARCEQQCPRDGEEHALWQALPALSALQKVSLMMI